MSRAATNSLETATPVATYALETRSRYFAVRTHAQGTTKWGYGDTAEAARADSDAEALLGATKHVHVYAWTGKIRGKRDERVFALVL